MSTITIPQPDVSDAAFNGRGCEFVDGEWMELVVSTRSRRIAMLLGSRLALIVEPASLGMIVGSDCGFKCFESATGEKLRLRRPDVAFVAAGKMVWIIDPDSQTVEIDRANGTCERLHVDEILSTENIIPGFECRVRELFPPLPVKM